MITSFQKIFKPTPEDEKRFQEGTERIKNTLKEQKSCFYCKNHYTEPHYELSCYAGEDVYCSKTNELRNGENGQECLFWEYNEEI